MSVFPHLHVASAHSTHHGTTSPEQLVSQVAQWGCEFAAITDRDGLYGAVRHIRACLEYGLRPIVGVDLALAPATRSPVATHPAATALTAATSTHPPLGTSMRVPSDRVTVLAHGNTAGAGWAALCRLVSAAHVPARGASPAQQRQHQPALPVSRFASFVRGAGDSPATAPLGTVLLGPWSDVGRAVLHGNDDLARARLARWHRALPGAVAIEIVCHLTEPGTAASVRHAGRMLALANELGVPAVLSNQVRYLTADDALTGDVLDAADALQPLGSFPLQANAQAWLKPPERMRALAQLVSSRCGLGSRGHEQLLATTHALAERCALDPVTDLHWREPKVPEASVLGLTDDPNTVLRQRCLAAVHERFATASSTEHRRITDRLDHELQTISGFGFATYFLTVADVSALIQRLGIRNQARGSGASSLVNYLLRISNVNPIEHDLVFERFLGHKRSTLPDIDIDVESARRHEVYRAIFKRYGAERVTLLSMHSTYRARGAARDAGLALGLPESRIDEIAKSLWRLSASQVRAGFAQRPELASLAEQAFHDRDLNLLLDLAERLDRLPCHRSMHPCGVLLGNASLLSTTPVQPSGIGLPMSQFDKDDIDDMGLLKLDVLGVRMQSSLAYTVAEIERVHGSQAAVRGGLRPDVSYVSGGGRIIIDEIPKTDEPTFEQIRSTHTLGMFQIESPGQRELIGKLQPDVYNDLIADISLFRPGPMKGNMVTPFLDVKHGYASPKWLHPSFRSFLHETYGVVVYHEQVLRILHHCMNISLADADELRRSMEKHTDGIEALFRTRTRETLDADGVRMFSDAQIDAIWEVLRGFGSFGFCKAHAAAFALPTWQSAWLKTHYPAEFFAGLLTHDPGMYPKRLLLGDARRMGVPILPVDVNISTREFVVERVRATPPGCATRAGDLGIRLSLADIRGISEAETARILTERPFTSVHDFLLRARPSRILAERLALIGALDTLEPNAATRSELVAAVRTAPRPKRRAPHTSAIELPLDFRSTAGALPRTGTREMSARERVHAELDILALDLSEHVIDGYRPLLDALNVTTADALVTLRAGTEVTVAGVRVATQTPPMRSGKRVVFISVDDGTGCADATFFDDAQACSGDVLFGTPLLLIHGKVRRTGERGVSIQATSARDLKLAWQEFTELQHAS